MKKLLVCLCLTLLTNCSLVGVENPSMPIRSTHVARVTYYSPQAPYGNRVACPNIKRATEGVTVAAHPDFKFGTKVYIPNLKGELGDGYFTVQDRGTAVTQKKAAKGKAYVVDIFVNSQSKLKSLAKTKPEYMKVYVVSS